mgnify:FL=1
MIKARDALTKIKPYVPGKPIEEVKRELGLDDVIKLASNENPYGPSKKALEIIDSYLTNLNLYPDGRAFELKTALSNYYQVQEEEIIVGNGSDEVIKLLSEAYLNPGDNIVQADVTFSEYEFGALLMGAKVKKVPLKDFTHDLEASYNYIDDNTKLIYICNPNNPTGTMVTEVELIEFLEKIPKGVLVVLDEAYAEYVADTSYPNSLGLINKYPLVVLRTFSKIYGLAGLRVGFGIAQKEIIANLEKAREPFNVNLLGQVAAVRALDDKEHLEYSFRENAKARESFYQECQKRDIKYVKSHTNFVLMQVEDADTIFNKMLKKGVIVRSGSVFGLNRFIRVTLGSIEQMQRFWQVFDEIGG